MEKTIELEKIYTEKNRIYYDLVDKSGMKLLKTPRVKAWIQYDHAEEFDFDISKIPQSILAIPLSLYLLPITYYYDINLELPVMDKELHENLPAIINAYAKIYGTLPQKQLYKRGGVWKTQCLA